MTATSPRSALRVRRPYTTTLNRACQHVADKLALGINPDMTPGGSHMIFDEADRLNFTVGNPASGGPIETSFAFMACDLAGQCWLSTARYADPIDFVLPNRK